MKIIKWSLQGITAGTTLRNQDMNMALNIPWDKQEVLNHRLALAKWLHTDLDHMVSPTQTHSTHLKKVSLETHGGEGMRTLSPLLDDVDATYTLDEELVLLTYHADCIPVLLYEPERRLIAAIHAGWKGNTNEIILKVIHQLIADEHINPKKMYAYIGPSLSYQNFEAKEDIIQKVKSMSFDTSSYYQQTSSTTYHLDGKGLALKQLIIAGLQPEHITMREECTKGDPEHFFSYRNDHQCGRHVSFIKMNKRN